MATSGTTTFQMNAREIGNAALDLLGVLADGDEMSPRDGRMVVLHLNLFLKTMQADGRNLWRNQDTELAWPADTAEQSLSPRVLDVFSVRLVQPQYLRQLAAWERAQYEQLPNPEASGLPTVFSLVKDRGEIKLRLWPVPTEAVDLILSTARVIEDVTDLDQTLDLPQEWLETIVYNLAARLIAPYNVAGIAPAVAGAVGAQAGALYQKLLDFDRPASVFMTPWASPQNGTYS